MQTVVALSDLLRDVTRARNAATAADRALRAAIYRAYQERGPETVAAIAEAAGLTRQRIYQIVDEERQHDR